MESDEVRSVYFILAAVYKRVRASRTTARFDCTEAEAPVQRKCYENFGEQGDIIGRLVTTWKAACDVAPETCGTSAATTIDMPVFNELRSWTKDLSMMTHYTFMQLYHYLVHSKEKTFDKSRWRP